MKSSLILFVAIALLTLPASMPASDISGTWIAEAPGGAGGETVKLTMTFKLDGTQLTGTLDNPSAGPTDIKDGKVEGDDISFYLMRNIGGNDMKILWKGKIAGEEIKFTRTVEGMAGFGGGAGGPGGGAPGGGAPAAEIIAKKAK